MEDIEAMLCAYVEGDLDEAGKAEIERHLIIHPQHRKLLADLIAQRKLLRGLPRATASGEVDESIKGQMERSILLDAPQSAATALPGRGWRPTQVMAIAAIVLLSVALGMILYRTLVPTLKPPTFTQVAVNKQLPAASDIETDIKTAHEKEADRDANINDAAKDEVTAANPAVPTVPAVPSAAPIVPPAAQSIAPIQTTNLDTSQSTASSANIIGSPVDVDQIRSRAAKSGLIVASPAVVVINTNSPAATGDQVTHYLATQQNITWRQLPDAGRPPSGLAGGALGGGIPSTLPSSRPSASETGLLAAAPTSQPSTQPTVYVARGFRRAQADELKSLLGQQNPSSVQISGDFPDDSAASRPTTTMSVRINGATTQPGQVTAFLGASTQPELMNLAPNSNLNDNSVDTVIVVQQVQALPLKLHSDDIKFRASTTQLDQLLTPPTTEPTTRP